MPNWKKVVVSGSDATLNSLYATGPITGSDVKINDWGSVSASLASINSGASSLTLQDVTDNGNTTTNDIYISSSKSLYLGANSYIRREQNGGGNENIQLNGSVRLNPNTSANANNGVVIGGNGYLLAPNSSRNAQLNYGSVSGQLGVYKLNVYGGTSTFQQGVTITGSLETTGPITGSGLVITGSAILNDSYLKINTTYTDIGVDVTRVSNPDNSLLTGLWMINSGSGPFGKMSNVVFQSPGLGDARIEYGKNAISQLTLNLDNSIYLTLSGSSSNTYSTIFSRKSGGTGSLSWDLGGLPIVENTGNGNYYYGTASYATQALSSSYSPNFSNTDLTLTGNRTHNLGGNDLKFNASQGETFHISSSNSSEVLISGLPTQTRSYVVGYNPVDGALYAMATSSVAGVTPTLQQVTTAGSTTTTNMTIGGNLIVTGSIATRDGYRAVLKRQITDGNSHDLTGNVDVSTYYGGTIDYTVSNIDQNQLRTGRVMWVSDGAEVSLTETTTAGIGDTSGITIDGSINGGNVDILMNNNSGQTVNVVWDYKLMDFS